MNWKKIFLFLFVVFCVWFVITQPDAAAHTTSSIGGHLKDAANSASHFVANVTR